MPLYEFLCPECGSTDEVFYRTLQAEVKPPACTKDGCAAKGKEMRRIVSRFARHLTMADQLAEAEAKWGKEVESAMGAEPDVAKYARRYESLAKDLPPPD